MLESETLKKVVSWANGSDEAEEKKDGQLHPIPVVTLFDDDQKLIDELNDRIVEKSGRSYTRNELINFLTCIFQGYITTFAGMPGTGKTSLCRIIADALGLNSRMESRIAEVSVERGWTSYRDYIGYYNPLSKMTEIANPEAYGAFWTLDHEARANLASDKAAPYFILLDEANLSPIEHYWAPFLKACDSFRQGSFTLTLGGDASFRVPEQVRFLATVNYDHTTEELSPRFLDRSWVVLLDPDKIENDEDQTLSPSYEEAVASYEPLSYKRLMDVFGPQGQMTIDAQTDELLGSVLKACEDARKPVSQRSQIMIRNYVRTASRLMDTSSVKERYAPLDFAVAQKILPLVSGTPESCKPLLDGLEKACAQLPHSLRLCQNMQELGKSTGYYQFFA